MLISESSISTPTLLPFHSHVDSLLKKKIRKTRGRVCSPESEQADAEGQTTKGAAELSSPDRRRRMKSERNKRQYAKRKEQKALSQSAKTLHEEFVHRVKNGSHYADPFDILYKKSTWMPDRVCRMCGRIATGKREQDPVVLLGAKVLDLEHKLRQLEQQNQRLRDQLEQREASNNVDGLGLVELAKILNRNDIKIKTRHLTDAFILKAQEPHEARVESSLSTAWALAGATTNKLNEQRVERLLSQQRRYRRSFKKPSDYASKSPFFVDIFGNNALVYAKEGEMLMYINKGVDLTDCTVLAAHVDGKFTRPVNGMRQSFEFVLVCERAGKRFSFTFAFALLGGHSQEFYKNFFRQLVRHHCPKPPVIVTDFEIAIANAIQEEWEPNPPEVRGCYFHYTQNLLGYGSRLKRYLGSLPSDFCFNVLKVLPFCDQPESLLGTFLQSTQKQSELDFSSIDVKMCLYVYNTYVRKLRKIFFVDLERSAIKTNNACEGRNSWLSRSFAQRPNISELLDFITVKFKKDVVRSNAAHCHESPYDKQCLALQRYLRDEPGKTLTWLALTKRITREVLSNVNVQEGVGQARDQPVMDQSQAAAFLSRSAQDFAEYRKRRRVFYKSVHSQFKDAVVIDVDNSKEERVLDGPSTRQPSCDDTPSEAELEDEAALSELIRGEESAPEDSEEEGSRFSDGEAN